MMMDDATTIGRLTKDGALVGYVAIDTQEWRFSARQGVRKKRWSGRRTRYRLDLLDDWDEGFLDAEDEAELASGWFSFRGEVLAYEELEVAERDAVASERFSSWD